MRGTMELNEVKPYVEACIHDEAAPCSCSCPYGLNVRSVMKKLSKGRLSSAYKEYRTATVFPTVAAALCDHPCEGLCQRIKIGDEAVDIGGLEKALLTLCKPQPADIFQIPLKETAVAVIGAGCTGLSLALQMAQKKYPVTVFEQDKKWGGSLQSHPDFEIFEEDIRFQLSQEKIDFRFGTKIASLEELSDYSAVYIATGRDGDDFGLLESWDKNFFTTSEKAVFMAGMLCGQSVTEGIAAGSPVSRYMECVIQTGRVIPEAVKKCTAEVDLVPKGAESTAKIIPTDPEAGYTKDEIKQEASRCFLCNCDKCMKGCELMNKYGKPPLQAGNEVIADLGAHFLASRTMTRQSYSCNQCGWCESICPEKIGMGEVFHTSRTERVLKGIQPEAFHDHWLAELEFVSGEAFYKSPLDGREKYDYIFFPGCQAGASLPEQVISAGNWLRENFDAGILLGCCGASAWWAGEKARWEKNTELLKSVWEEMGKPVFVLACATCSDMLERFLPEIETVSVYELMAEKGLQGTALMEKAALFDPCSARYNKTMRNAVRSLGSLSGCDVEETSESGRCCGWGGHMKSVNPPLYDTIVGHRMELSELPFLVYCSNCRDVFLEKGKPCRHILEFLFGAEDRQYHLQEKKENRLTVKETFQEAYEGKKDKRMTNEWDGLVIRVPGEVRLEMEKQLISDEELKECIWRSEKDGDRFSNEDGTYLASMTKRIVTYWVEYRKGGDEFEILSAYCHRMKILGV